jgi:hypothetical protein
MGTKSKKGKKKKGQSGVGAKSLNEKKVAEHKGLITELLHEVDEVYLHKADAVKENEEMKRENDERKAWEEDVMATMRSKIESNLVFISKLREQLRLLHVEKEELETLSKDTEEKRETMIEVIWWNVSNNTYCILTYPKIVSLLNQSFILLHITLHFT